MITKPTVLILGAGASMDFDFPNGIVLRNQLCALNNAYGDLKTAFDTYGFYESDRSSFCAALHGSSAQSVDVFLETRPDLLEIGKFAIASALIPYEQPGKIQPLKERPTWLEVLFDRMRAPASSWGDNQLTIVTFNYDRVLEHFLRESLKHTFRLTDTGADELRQRAVPIIHLHGILGDYGVTHDASIRPFHPDMNPRQIKVAAERIRIVHEGSETDEVFVAARTAMQAAQEIVLMGFGYGEMNLKRLLDGFRGGQVVRGSSIGMLERECQNVGARSDGRISLDTTSKDLATFLRANSVLGN